MGGGNATYAYDGVGNRVEKISPSGTQYDLAVFGCRFMRPIRNSGSFGRVWRIRLRWRRSQSIIQRTNTRTSGPP
jgi:hypothetical protein